MRSDAKEYERRYYATHKAEIAARRKRYYEANKEKIAEQRTIINQQYRINHKEEIRAKQKEYRGKHREEILAKKKMWYEAHKKEIAESKKQYRATHKSEIAERKQRYYMANKAKISERHKKYRLTHLEQERERTKRLRRNRPLYSIWEGVLQRTGVMGGASCKSLNRYRDRGISVCDEWRTFKPFEDWAMSHGWRKGLQIDRINNDGNYEPYNCRFVTAKENMRNTSKTVRVVWNGKTMPLKEVWEKSSCKLPYQTVFQRVVKRHWTLERALTEPPQNQGGAQCPTR